MDKIPQRKGQYPATQSACCNFWKSNAQTVKQIMDKLKKVSRLKKKKNKKKRVDTIVIVNQKTQARQN